MQARFPVETGLLVILAGLFHDRRRRDTCEQCSETNDPERLEKRDGAFQVTPQLSF